MTRFKVFLLFMLIANVVSAQTRKLNGLVTDAANKGVPSATVKVKGSAVQGLTNIDGKFSITVPSENIVLEISSVGFEPKEVAVSATDNDISITMNDASKALSEVVVTALGIKREKKSLTYATQQIGGDELTKAANNNFMNALSGKVAGVNISTSNSGAGGSTKAVLRGSKSLTGTSEALYVIDGVPLVNNKGGQPGSYGGTDAGDGLSAINPGDIESISVLRGASASILYGSQGANGVILITTKKGKQGRATVSINSSTIFDQGPWHAPVGVQVNWNELSVSTKGMLVASVSTHGVPAALGTRGSTKKGSAPASAMGKAADEITPAAEAFRALAAVVGVGDRGSTLAAARAAGSREAAGDASGRAV